MRDGTEPENVQISSKLDNLPRTVGLSTMDLVDYLLQLMHFCFKYNEGHLTRNDYVLTIDTRRLDQFFRTPILSNAISRRRLAIVPSVPFQLPSH